ncbi:helix-hairpin-helix domain-containing protein [Candidatus Dojkabacteria bacterium]|nr:helix-hairpin-helix domain-containing protein [Candidatus Dojkabacteria bacterium]
MNLYEKISILGPNAQYDTCGPKDFGKTTDIPGVYHAKVAGNNVCRLFKVLQSNKCVKNCKYCAFRRDRSTPRAEASPLEMAKAFESAFSRRLVDGLFLSSAIDGHPDTTMTKLLDTAHILREKFKYKGYLHLKIMPGAASNCIDETLKLANRVSVNIEAPTEKDLHFLSPEKHLENDILTTFSLIHQKIQLLKTTQNRVPSITTQFIVGAGEERDKDIIKSTKLLYNKFELQRVFYSAFRPVDQTPLEEKPSTSLTREHRLYQSDFLMRIYKFSPDEIPLDNDGFLFETDDPKTLWVQAHPEIFPMNINTARYFDLLKIPGIGPETAKKIIALRSINKIQFYSDLLSQRIQVDKIMPYVYFR